VKCPERLHCVLDRDARLLAHAIGRGAHFQFLAIAALPLGIGKSHGAGLAGCSTPRNPDLPVT
jgi:hypothetical protein